MWVLLEPQPPTDLAGTPWGPGTAGAPSPTQGAGSVPPGDACTASPPSSGRVLPPCMMPFPFWKIFCKIRSTRRPVPRLPSIETPPEERARGQPRPLTPRGSDTLLYRKGPMREPPAMTRALLVSICPLAGSQTNVAKQGLT